MKLRRRNRLISFLPNKWMYILFIFLSTATAGHTLSCNSISVDQPNSITQPEIAITPPPDQDSIHLKSSNLDIVKSPPEIWLSYREAGLAYFDAGQYEQAFKNFENMKKTGLSIYVAKDPETWWSISSASYWIGRTNQKLGNDTLAIENFTYGLSLELQKVACESLDENGCLSSSTLHHFYLYRGIAYMTLGKVSGDKNVLGQALNDFDSAIAEIPTGQAYIERSKYWSFLNEDDLAIKDMQFAKNKSPELFPAYSIFDAVAQGDISMVKQHMETGTNINAVFVDAIEGSEYSVAGYGGFPIHFATLYENEMMLEFLLDHGADINIKAMDMYKGATESTLVQEDRKQFFFVGGTALHWAAHLGSVRMVKSLIRLGADVNARQRYGYTPLDTAFNSPRLLQDDFDKITSLIRDNGGIRTE